MAAAPPVSRLGRLGGMELQPGRLRSAEPCSENSTGMIAMEGRGMPASRYGLNTACRTALHAASSSRGCPLER